MSFSGVCKVTYPSAEGAPCPGVAVAFRGSSCRGTGTQRRGEERTAERRNIACKDDTEWKGGRVLKFHHRRFALVLTLL